MAEDAYSYNMEGNGSSDSLKGSENVGAPTASTANKMSRKIIFPLVERIYGTRLTRCLSFLKESQWWLEQRLRCFQQERLQTLLKHTYENVPYYRELFNKLRLKPEDIRTIEDLPKLPILEKEEIRENFGTGRVVAQNVSKKRLIYSSTSGSTGEPLSFYKDKISDSWNWACKFRGFEWAGYRLGDKNARIVGNPEIIEKSGKLLEKIKRGLFNMLFIPAFEIKEENIDKFVSLISQFKPVMIRGYAASIYVLADYLDEKDLNIHRPRCVVITGEKCFDWQRRVIEHQFGCGVFDDYGSIEINSIAHECDQHLGMHVSMENVIVEFVDEHDEVIRNGRIGDIVVTSLNNFSVPFIRYRLGDRGRYLNVKCPCGRELYLIDHIEGRIPDVIFTPSGKHLSVHFFTILFKHVASVKQFQIRQKSGSQLETLIVVNRNFDTKDLTMINKRIQEYVGSDMVNSVKIVDNIPLDSSGKRKFIISEVTE